LTRWLYLGLSVWQEEFPEIDAVETACDEDIVASANRVLETDILART